MPITSLIISLASVTLLAACASSEQRPSSSQTSTENQAVLHTISGTKLRDTMHRLSNLVTERSLTEPELDNQRGKVSAQVLEAADGVENTLECILKAEPRLKLDANQKSQFHALTQKLRDETKLLRTQTQTYQFASIAKTLENMNASCTSCHELFHLNPIDPVP